MHKNGIYFPFDFVGILSILILSAKNRGEGVSGDAFQTKSIRHDKSYLSTVPKRT